MPWGRFSTDDQLRHRKYEPQLLHLDPLILEVAANHSSLLDHEPWQLEEDNMYIYLCSHWCETKGDSRSKV